jgi:hypothetical protein
MGNKGHGARHAAREYDRAERRQAKQAKRDERRQARGPTSARRTDRPTNSYGGPPRQPPPPGP